MEFRQMSINRDPLATPICDRFLPSHPKEIHGHLPYWYMRTRYPQYGLPDMDLPLRAIKRRPEHNERYWHKETRYQGMPVWETFYPIGALLPFHYLFSTMHPSLEVVGEKIDRSKPWAFRYID